MKSPCLPAARPCCLALILIFSSWLNLPCSSAESSDPLPAFAEALASKVDLYGEAALRQPDGASYEFFAPLLPPLRYVNAAFHYYPIVLSAPDAPQKARLASNGSAINPRAGLKSWKEKGVPVSFMVGEDRKPFGAELRNVTGPHYEQGWLPIVQIAYADGETKYDEETFASVDPEFAAHGIAFVQFKVTGRGGKITAQIAAPAPLKSSGNALVTTNGLALVWFDQQWKWDAAQQTLTATPAGGRAAYMAVASTPMMLPAPGVSSFFAREYYKQRRRCIAEWRHFFKNGMQLEIPEPVVQNAWHSLLIGNSIMARGDQPNYSWGNAYERLYEAECGDAVRAFLLWGVADARRMVPPLLDYSNDKLQFHNAGFKLQTLAHYYWITRDAGFVRSVKERWQKCVSLIIEGREKESGLAPREGYCGDIFTSVYSLNSNASGWRGLRDFAAVLDDMGDHDEAARLAAVAADYRRRILAAVDKSRDNGVQPSFIPIALFGEEKPYDTLTGSKLGGYWNLLAPYVLGSGVFGHGSEKEKAMLDYIQQQGGIFMGMTRFDQHSGLFANENAVDDLYGLRYVNTLLRLDDPEHALVSFYGKLAQGMTQDTFIGAEGTGLKPLDEYGRPMYLPPNSSANASFLWTLRYLLIQDWDMNDDGKPDTLRLLFATPRRWLEDGKTIKLENAPTAFGKVSLTVKSRLKQGEVIAEIEPPLRQTPDETRLRIRLPGGWNVVSADIIKSEASLRTSSLFVDERGTVKLPPLTQRFTIRFRVSHTDP